MKYFGFILICLGIALILYIGYSYVGKGNRVLTPVPDDNGVDVIYVTPNK